VSSKRPEAKMRQRTSNGCQIEKESKKNQKPKVTKKLAKR
jgi:hypothetical protein